MDVPTTAQSPAAEVTPSGTPSPCPASPSFRLRAFVKHGLRQSLRSVVVLSLVAVILINVSLGIVHVYAYVHYRAAFDESAANHDAQAKNHLRACLRIWPHDPQCLLLAARTARRLGALDEAEVLLNNCQTARGKEDDDVYLERVLLRAERGEAESAAPLCRRLVEARDPRTPLILEALVHGFIRVYRYDEAAHWLKVWSDRQPDSAMPIYFQALILEMRGQLQEATQGFSRALEIDPAQDEARTHLASLLIEMGQGHTAIPHVEYLLSRYPEDRQTRLALARCFDQVGEQGKAETLLDEILDREPNFADALAERGKLAYRNKQLQRAEECLRRASVFEPGDFQVQYTLYLCLVDLGKTEEAQAAQVRWKQVEEDLRRIQEIVSVKMQRNPHDAGLHFEAGLISMRCGQPKEGLRWFHSALKEDPQHAATHRALAAYYKSVGQFGRSSRHRQSADKSDANAGVISPPTPMSK